MADVSCVLVLLVAISFLSGGVSARSTPLYSGLVTMDLPMIHRDGFLVGSTGCVYGIGLFAGSTISLHGKADVPEGSGLKLKLNVFKTNLCYPTHIII